MGALVPADYDGIAHHDHRVYLHDVSWEDYERLLEIRGDHSGPRYTYLEGELEMMSSSRTHEFVKRVIGCLIEVWCQEKGIEFTTLGSWTLQNKAAKSAAEPDECYIFGDGSEASAPHLAIEVEWTRGGINNFRFIASWVWGRFGFGRTGASRRTSSATKTTSRSNTATCFPVSICACSNASWIPPPPAAPCVSTGTRFVAE